MDANEDAPEVEEEPQAQAPAGEQLNLHDILALKHARCAEASSGPKADPKAAPKPKGKYNVGGKAAKKM